MSQGARPPSVAIEERDRLIRLCASVTGNSSVAEDLAQETLFQAWRSRESLRDPARESAWLSGIARNVCRHWLRKQGQNTPLHEHAGLQQPQDNEPAAGLDLDLELERSELADLLDRAMELLRPDVRAILLQRYIEDRAHADIADRLRISEGAVKVRIQRGRLALQRVLVEQFPEHLASYGMLPPRADRWENTRIWCWRCGLHQMVARRTEDGTELWLRCPACCSGPDELMTRTTLPSHAGSVSTKSYTAALADLAAQAGSFYRDAVTSGVVPCDRCSRPAHFQPGRPLDPRPYGHLNHFGVIRCRHCGEIAEVPLTALTMMLREGQAFRETHRRIRMLPEREIEVDGGSIILTSLESVTAPIRLEAIYARHTYRLLHIDGSSAPWRGTCRAGGSISLSAIKSGGGGVGEPDAEGVRMRD
jgi:RNA polymerase sigma factor (sigma-70 family)